MVCFCSFPWCHSRDEMSDDPKMNEMITKRVERQRQDRNIRVTVAEQKMCRKNKTACD